MDPLLKREIGLEFGTYFGVWTGSVIKAIPMLERLFTETTCQEVSGATQAMEGIGLLTEVEGIKLENHVVQEYARLYSPTKISEYVADIWVDHGEYFKGFDDLVDEAEMRLGNALPDLRDCQNTLKELTATLDKVFYAVSTKPSAVMIGALETDRPLKEGIREVLKTPKEFLKFNRQLLDIELSQRTLKKGCDAGKDKMIRKEDAFKVTTLQRSGDRAYNIYTSLVLRGVASIIYK